MKENGHLLTLQFDCEPAIALISGCLKAAGLKTVRTFDLRSACASFEDHSCAHHRTAPCDCQMVVLLAYGNGPHPVSLVVHTHLSVSDIQMVHFPGSISSELEERIKDALLVNGEGAEAEVDSCHVI